MDWLQILGAAGTFAVIVGGCASVHFPLKGRRDKAAADLAAERSLTLKRDIADAVTVQLVPVREGIEKLREHAEATDLQLAIQFGGNGGGMREAINKQAGDLANLAGKFEQHMVEASR